MANERHRIRTREDENRHKQGQSIDAKWASAKVNRQNNFKAIIGQFIADFRTILVRSKVVSKQYFVFQKYTTGIGVYTFYEPFKDTNMKNCERLGIFYFFGFCSTKNFLHLVHIKSEKRTSAVKEWDIIIKKDLKVDGQIFFARWTQNHATFFFCFCHFPRSFTLLIYRFPSL